MAVQAQLYSENLGFPFGGSQGWMDNADGFNESCLNLHQQTQQQRLLQNQVFQQDVQRNQSLCFDKGALLSKNVFNNHQSMAFSGSVGCQIEKQRNEIDQIISLQNEELRVALQEQRKQLMMLLLKKYESRTQLLLNRKDEEISKAVNRAMELEQLLKRMELENQTWQRLAKENEAMVMSLNNTIEHLRDSVCLSPSGVDDAESCCDMTNNREETAVGNSSRGNVHPQGNDEQITRKMICKNCHSRSSCVILLPCRHLCSCKACESFLDSCPVCNMAKKASIEALI